MSTTEARSSGSTAESELSVLTPQRRQARRRYTDAIYHGASFTVALSMVAILGGIILVLMLTAWKAFGSNGLGFFTGSVWNSGADIYGALPFIAGTAITTAIALLIAVPVSLGIAVLVAEFLPARLAGIVGIVIDVASGVPTIVFGTWAAIALLPWMQNTAEPAIASVLGWLPLFNRDDIRAGYSVLSAGLVLAAMIFPTIVVVTRNSLLAASYEQREASLGLGATRWETATKVILRQARAGAIGAIVLACGRALGETMAVVYVIGNSNFIPNSLFDKGQTIASQLLLQMFLSGPLPGSLNNASLYELGVILLVFSLLTSLIGRYLTTRLVGSGALAGGGR